MWIIYTVINGVVYLTIILGQDAVVKPLEE